VPNILFTRTTLRSLGSVVPAVLSASVLAIFSTSNLRAQYATQPPLEGDAPSVISLPDVEHLRQWHEMLASEPHVAGSPGDARVIEKLVAAFKGMGLEVEEHKFWAYLPTPIAAELELVTPEKRTFSLKETPLAEDEYSQNAAHTFGWNGYSGSGDVTAHVVYANYGTKSDFAKLKELGVDCAGKIVIARYGGNYRGFKAKFAQAAGAAGLIIYTDPADSGFAKGLMYPEGGWANETCIERGSLHTLDYQGDPLTPGIEATKDAKRLDPATVDLPKIPVQPVGWSVAVEIMKRMKGAAVPGGWQGGLPLPYRVEGGDEMTVRLMVKQDRSIVQTSNVTATLKGTESPETKIVMGCHHDAWGNGAADPTCGTITMIESARVFAKLAAQGHRPRRTIVFAAWGAEEMGIIGSTEWVEAHYQDLKANAAAYINLDMASMGVDFGSSASPSLQQVVMIAASEVPQARKTDGSKVLQAWLARAPNPARASWPIFGDLGGGSDHVGFLCHAGVPSLSLGAGGAQGTSYHSIYDTLTWYRKVVGEDYEPALMVTRMAARVADLLANRPVLPLDPAHAATETLRLLKDLNARAGELGLIAGYTVPAGPNAIETMHPALQRVAKAAERLQERTTAVRALLNAGPSSFTSEALGGAALTNQLMRDGISQQLLAADRAWLSNEGLVGRPWYKNLYAAPDRDSGYAPWMLPGLRAAIESKDAAALDAASAECVRALESIEKFYALIERAMGL